MTTGAQIKDNLAEVRARIAKAAAAAGRAPEDIALIAVSKTHPAARIRRALEAGQRLFGENRVQEAAAKWPELRADFPNVELHLIGPLQSNKAEEAVALFDVIHSLDRPKLARVFADLYAKRGGGPKLFIQVNTGEEPQKSGVLPGEADGFIAQCRDELGLPVIGLMCLPPIDEEPALHFALLEKIAKRNGLDCLSMGMTHDFETAIEFGSTHVRVGTAIFGEREKPQKG